MLRLVGEKKMKLYLIEAGHLRKDIEFKVISKCVIDSNTEEYFTIEHALIERDLEELLVEEDIFVEGTEPFYRYVLKDDDNVNILAAKMSGLSVVEMLTGQMKGKQFLYSNLGVDSIEAQLAMYSFLTYEHVEHVLVSKLNNNSDLRRSLRSISGHVLYELLAQYLGIHPNDDIVQQEIKESKEYLLLDKFIEWKKFHPTQDLQCNSNLFAFKIFSNKREHLSIIDMLLLNREYKTMTALDILKV